MASFGEERSTIAADRIDSNDAKSTNNNYRNSLMDLNGENYKIYRNRSGRVTDEIVEMANNESLSSSKMDENQSNAIAATDATSKIVDGKNGINSLMESEHNVNDIDCHALVQVQQKPVHKPLIAAQSSGVTTVTHNNCMENPKTPVSNCDKSKSNANAKHSCADDATIGERGTTQHSHHSSKTQSINCGKFPIRSDCRVHRTNGTLSHLFSFNFADESIRVHKKKKKDRDREKDRSRNGGSGKDKSKDKSHSKHRHHSSSTSSSSSSKLMDKTNGKIDNIVRTTGMPPPTPTANDVTSESTNIESASRPTAVNVVPEPSVTVNSSQPLSSCPPVANAPINDDIVNGSSPVKIERNLAAISEQIVPPAQPLPMPIERKPTEGAGIVIKKDYLPSPAKKMRVEKTRDDVTRVLNYETELNCPFRSVATKPMDESIKCETKIKTEPVDSETNVPKMALGSSNVENISDNKENAITGGVDTKTALREKIPIDTIHATSINVEAATISDTHNERKSIKGDGHHHSSGTSNSNKTSSASSSRHSSSRSSRECSRCYRRSKVKRVNTGVQCHRYGEPFKYITPTSTPMKAGQTLMCNMTDSLYSDLKYGRFFHVEVHTNGGASIVHMYQNEINSLNEAEMDELTEEFFRIVFSEDENGYAHHVMGIVHGAAEYIPDLLEHMADNYSTLTVKAGVLGRNSDIETSTIAQYYEQVEKHYAQGTFRYGPLHQISLVGKVHEEVGGYFPDLLGRLEQNPFLNKVSGLAVVMFRLENSK